MSSNQYITNLIQTVYKGDLKVEGSATILTVKVTDRTKVKSDLYAYLDKNNYPYADEKSTKSSFNITKIKTPDNKLVSIVWKNLTGSSGSGAGAEITTLGESAQCWYTAVAFYYSLNSQDDMLEKKNLVEKLCDTTATWEEINKKLPDDWVKSSIMIANKMKMLPQFKTNLKRYYFHRGSAVVDKISSMFLSANKKDTLFININKWTPADIWLMTDDGKKQIISAPIDQTFASLNSLITKLYVSGDLIGVSLKKVGNQVKAEVFNFESNKYIPKLNKYIISEKSKDGYIEFSYKSDSAMKIQFRSFSDTGSWQGEIKGKYAAGGKIGGGQIASIVKRVAQKSLSSLDAKSITKRVQSKDKKLILELSQMASSVGLKLSEVYISMQSNDWIYSKYLTLEFISVFKTLNANNQERILNEIIGYSSSSTENSAVFIKMS